MRASDFNAAVQALGAGCQEHQPGIDSGWGLECMRDSSAYLSATGTGSDQITMGQASILASSASDLTSPGALAWLLAVASVPYEGSDATALRAWVTERITDSACENGDACRITIGSAVWRLYRNPGALGGPPEVGMSFLSTAIAEQPVSHAPGESQAASSAK